MDNIEEMRLHELQAEVDKAAEKCRRVTALMNDAVRTVVGSVLEKCGQTGVEIEDGDDPNRIRIVNSSNHFYRMDIEVRNAYCETPHVAIQIGGYGYVERNDPLLPVMAVAGYVARNLERIETLLLSLGWDALNEARMELSKATGALREMKTRFAEASREREKAKYEGMLVEGAFLTFKRANGVMTYSKIERVTKRCVFVAYGRREGKDMLLDKIARGVYTIATADEVAAYVNSNKANACVFQ